MSKIKQIQSLGQRSQFKQNTPSSTNLSTRIPGEWFCEEFAVWPHTDDVTKSKRLHRVCLGVRFFIRQYTSIEFKLRIRYEFPLGSY